MFGFGGQHILYFFLQDLNQKHVSLCDKSLLHSEEKTSFLFSRFIASSYAGALRARQEYTCFDSNLNRVIQKKVNICFPPLPRSVKNDATDREAVSLIGRGLWEGIITVDVQVPGVGSGVRACGPEVAVRTLTVNLTVNPAHGA